MLLSLPYKHQWNEKDLSNETYLRIGLLLLYNKVQGKSYAGDGKGQKKSGLAIGRSIHINYTNFPKKFIKNAEKAMKPDKARMNIAREINLAK